jgi:hypothetical protein
VATFIHNSNHAEVLRRLIKRLLNAATIMLPQISLNLLSSKTF